MTRQQQPRKGISYQVCDRIILEYDREQQVQSVFWCDGEERELKSSFVCPPGKRAVHAFTETIKYKDNNYHETLFKIRFAAEPTSGRVIYRIRYRRENSAESPWLLWQSNIKPNRLLQFPSINLPNDEEVGDDEPNCKECGSDLVCTDCNPSTCEDCDSIITKCADCEAKQSIHGGLRAFDSVRMQEKLSQIDADVLQSALLEHLGDFADHTLPWPGFLKELLDGLGENTSSVSLNLTKNTEPEDIADTDQATG